MGWLFTQGQSRSELVRRLTKPWTNEEEGVTAKCLAHTAVGNVLWKVMEFTRRDGKVERYIGCDLMAPQRGYGWGYKDMDESMGPCYYSCPLKYLDMVPEPESPHARGWRVKVREYHTQRAAQQDRLRRLKVGDTLPLPGCTIPEVTIASVRPLRGHYNGRIYRIPLKCLALPVTS